MTERAMNPHHEREDARKSRSLLLSLGIAFAAASSVAIGAADAQNVAAFYAGKTIRLIVGVGVGSGYDVNARLLARHMAKHVPGNPSFVVQNQPGAASAAMTNQLFAVGPFDGTVVGAGFAGLPTTPLLQPSLARFDPAKLIWLGSTNRETNVTYVWHTVPIRSIGEVQFKELIMGAQGPGSTQVDLPLVANTLFGFKFKVVPGYESTAKINLALESGEVQGTVGGWSTIKSLSSKWLDDGKIRIVGQWALHPNPAVPSVSNMFDVAKTDAERDALRLVLARAEFARPFFLPPGVPADRVEALRDAFDDTMKDADYLAEAQKAGIDVDPLPGTEVARLIARVFGTPPQTVALVRNALDGR
jgi:tripartite-type tricarboxylate transporter receptor subunit TctC